MAEFWNGEPCEARKVWLTVDDAPEFPKYWARGLVGTQRSAVEVKYQDSTFYLDDVQMEEWETEPPGWFKVTEGMGSPQVGHRSLSPVPGSVVERV